MTGRIQTLGSRLGFIGLLLPISLAIPSCSLSRVRPEKPAAAKPIVSLMAYNMENLFDTQHDANTEDYTYLPLAIKHTKEHQQNCEDTSSARYLESCLKLDWSETILNRKFERLADVIMQVNGGHGPDILIVEEVENLNVLSKLNREYLKSAHYQTEVLLDGFDTRGIDIGFLSRFPLAEPARLHKIAFRPATPEDREGMARMRGILEATFVLADGQKLTVFGVHFPSQGNPHYWREQAVKFLNSLVEKLPEDRLAVAGGDFNIATSEERKFRLFRQELGSTWLVSHLIGCSGCQGTHYFHPEKSWSFLDALLFRKSMGAEGSSAWVIDPASIQVPNRSRFQSNRFLSPARFEPFGPVGVSDHWPIYGEIRKR